MSPRKNLCCGTYQSASDEYPQKMFDREIRKKNCLMSHQGASTRFHGEIRKIFISIFLLSRAMDVAKAQMDNLVLVLALQRTISLMTQLIPMLFTVYAVRVGRNQPALFDQFLLAVKIFIINRSNMAA